jgi:hypothetical protein
MDWDKVNRRAKVKAKGAEPIAPYGKGSWGKRLGKAKPLTALQRLAAHQKQSLTFRKKREEAGVLEIPEERRSATQDWPRPNFRGIVTGI